MSGTGIDIQGAMAMANAPAIQTPSATKDVAAAKKAATAFESVFISQFVGQMFEGIKTDGMFGGGEGEEMFRSMMVDEYGKSIAAQGGFGLSDAVQRQLLKTQEAPAGMPMAMGAVH